MGQSNLAPAHLTHQRNVETRKWPRYLCGLDTRADLIADLGLQCLPVRVRNLSAGGISFIFERRVDPETLLTLRLRNPARGLTIEARIRVVYVVEHPSGEFVFGAAFTRELTDQEVRGLL